MVSTPENKNYKVIGTRPIRHDGYDKVTGRAQYGADIKLPGMLTGAVARSPYAHAKIKSIDTSEAEKMDGVFAVMTAKDLPRLGDVVRGNSEESGSEKHLSENVMAFDKVLYKGHVVAAVAAKDQNTAFEAVKKIKVDYEVLKPVIDVDQAMAKDASILHEDYSGDHLGKKVKNTNIAAHVRHENGDIDNGFEKSDLVVEKEVDMQTVHQGYLEPHSGTAVWDEEDRVKVWTSTQGSFAVRDSVSKVLDLDVSRVKVTPMEIGGGFGGKIPIYLEPISAVLSKKTRRPVKTLMSRTDVFDATGPGPGGKVKVKIGIDSEGKILAAYADIRLEAGAYPEAFIEAAAKCVFSCYDVPSMKIDAYDVVVNKPSSAPYRAPASPQVAFATETVVDEICNIKGYDPIDFRLKNVAEKGTRTALGPKYRTIGLKECLEAAKDSDHWKSNLDSNPKPGKKRGRGIASGYWFNIGFKSSVNLSLNPDGKVALIEGSTDIGGSRASIAMQAAEVLGIPAEDVRPSVVDTDSIGITDVTGGSRTTYATGYAAYNAAHKLIEQIIEKSALKWDINKDQIEYSDGVVKSKADSELKMTLKEIADDPPGGPIVSSASVDLEEAGGGFAVHIADLEIDEETGKTDIVNYTAIQDVGKAIHPSYVEGQMQGGAAQGIGWALNEEYFMSDDGIMLNSSYLDYRMPTSLDLPMINTIMVEVPSEEHPYGVRGVGEPPIVPPVPAIGNAINNALGLRLLSTPMKPSRITEALKRKK
ncbi:MAG: xanthine dehydrogenase family protein molybdopterin-binding subunit [Chloroflexota bacterium]|nr:xanthine dehydrogenase family protein molybdopterin-binding subunit [Chloroflexota bacterium]